mmetsp:Transcript_19721/g.23468  ORF Transcript_19721/g.23468 Transcript_19721/m.23468 type:complete len:374 (-) Transcript_19721:67-1188(-)
MFNLLRGISRVIEDRADMLSLRDIQRYQTALTWATLAYKDQNGRDIDDHNVEANKHPITLINAMKALPHHTSVFDSSGQTNTKVTVEYIPDSQGVLHIACRGTVCQKDWETNLNYNMIPLDPNHRGHSFNSNPNINKNDVLVHAGFMGATESIFPQVLDLILNALNASDDPKAQNRKKSHPPVKSIHISGHSLGGALACLLGLTLMKHERVLTLIEKNQDNSQNELKVNVITFGAPPVGNQAFIELLESLNSKLNHERIVLSSDPVPKLSHQGRHGQKDGESIQNEGFLHFPINPIILDDPLESYHKLATSATNAYQASVSANQAAATSEEEHVTNRWRAVRGVLSASRALVATGVKEHSVDTYWERLLQHYI